MDLEEVLAVVVRVLRRAQMHGYESDFDKEVLDEFMARHDHTKRPEMGVAALPADAKAELREAVETAGSDSEKEALLPVLEEQEE